MPLEFRPSPRMTLGVEIEMQLVDRLTRDLAPAALAVFEKVGETERIKPEFFLSMVEINTGICDTVAQVRNDLEGSIGSVRRACDALGIDVAMAGSHPFARYSERIPFPGDRYDHLIDRNRWLAQRLIIFGLHVHVGMRDGPHAMAMLNAMLHYAPHLLALSASSPFWQGGDTGLASSRVTIFEALPTAGHPCTFRTWDEFVAFYDALVASRGIKSIKDIWWDIRPHPDYGTVELRVCDGLQTVSETVGLVALVRCLYDWFDEQYRGGRGFEPPAYWVLRENKWRASRWGLEAEILLDERGRTGVLREEVTRLLRDLEPRAARLQCDGALAAVGRSLVAGAGYERQRRVFRRAGRLAAVVDAIVEELRTDRPADV
jgi:carboxylate-amine ligase